VLLLLINLFNYIDRQVLSAVEPEIRKHYLAPDSPGSFWLGLNDNPKFWTGCLAMAFLVCYMLFSPLFGWLADRFSRWLLVALGVAVWSLASGGSGLAATFTLLFLTRCCVGFGEAAYGPVAPTVISDLYPVSRRGSVLAWFYAAIPVGSALGYVLGASVKQRLGWEWAFYLVVPPGLALAAACLFMPEAPRGGADAAAVSGRKLSRAAYLTLLRNPSYLFCTFGMAAMTFALGGLAWWMPAYLEEHKGLPSSAVTLFGGIIVVTGLGATLVGGVAGDALKPRFGGSYFLVSGLAMLVGFPFLVLFLFVPFPLAWVPLTLGVFCLFFNTGPTNTILANVTHPAIRASAFAINIFVIHLLGDVISPPILGLLIGKENRYELGFLVVGALVLLGGVLWLWGTRHLERDTARAPTSLPD
jgi:MFS family permease